MNDWPPEVEDYYQGLSEKWNWPPSVLEAVRKNVNYLRELHDGNSSRQFFRGTDGGHDWFFEAAFDGHHWMVVRQAYFEPSRAAHCYSWTSLSTRGCVRGELEMPGAAVGRIESGLKRRQPPARQIPIGRPPPWPCVPHPENRSVRFACPGLGSSQAQRGLAGHRHAGVRELARAG